MDRRLDLSLGTGLDFRLGLGLGLDTGLGVRGATVVIDATTLIRRSIMEVDPHVLGVVVHAVAQRLDAVRASRILT